MGAPDQPDDFVRLQAEDLTIYLARDIWEQIKPGQSELLVGVSSYGRFWLHLTNK
jgi:hypothetical protein